MESAVGIREYPLLNSPFPTDSRDLRIVKILKNELVDEQVY
jgi:hypothetical protein